MLLKKHTPVSEACELESAPVCPPRLRAFVHAPVRRSASLSSGGTCTGSPNDCSFSFEFWEHVHRCRAGSTREHAQARWSHVLGVRTRVHISPDSVGFSRNPLPPQPPLVVPELVAGGAFPRSFLVPYLSGQNSGPIVLRFHTGFILYDQQPCQTRGVSCGGSREL